MTTTSCQVVVKETGYYGLDLGGTLCKIVFYERKGDASMKPIIDFITQNEKYGSTGQRDARLSVTLEEGRFHFIVFETRRMRQAVEMILENGLAPCIGKVSATGGGAFKFESLIHAAGQHGIQVLIKDEIACLIKGLDYLLKIVPDEAFIVESMSPIPKHPSIATQPTTLQTTPIDFTHQVSTELYPFLLVNVGTGVSIIKVAGPSQFERITGSGIGGGTYWGLVKLLTRVKTFEESLELCLQGDSRQVDMTVGDIYGGRDYAALNLDADMTASFFAKFVAKERDDTIKDADICRGLLNMVANNIGQVANLCAEKHGINKIFFAGNFLRGNQVSMQALSEGSRFWSQGRTRALFLKHEGYFGALGALLLS